MGWSFRIGRETNSSTSHSFVFVPKGLKKTDGEFELRLPPHPDWEGDTCEVILDWKVIASYLVFALAKYESFPEVTQTLIELYGDKKEKFFDDVQKLVRDGTVTAEPEISIDLFYDVPEEVSKEEVIKLFSKAVEELAKAPNLALVIERECDNIRFNGESVEWWDVVYHPLNNTVDSTLRFKVFKNGNYIYAHAFNNTTHLKFRYVPDGVKPEPIYPEAMDVKITDKCFAMCPFCYEGSTPDGKHADIKNVLRFIMSIKGKVGEIAIGGGNPLLYPYLEDILSVSVPDVGVNITARDVDWIEFLDAEKMGDRYITQIGFGVSVTTPKKAVEFYKKLIDINFGNNTPQVVYHVINGVHSTRTVKKLIEKHYDVTSTAPIVLILGFKRSGRGASFEPRRPINIEELMQEKVILQFDDLALEQLKVKDMVSDDYWALMYQGKDGDYTMFVDLVEMKFAKNSYNSVRIPITSKFEKEMNISYEFEAYEVMRKHNFPFQLEGDDNITYGITFNGLDIPKMFKIVRGL